MAPWCSGLTCHPVTVEIGGSNPPGVASNIFNVTLVGQSKEGLQFILRLDSNNLSTVIQPDFLKQYFGHLIPLSLVSYAPSLSHITQKVP